MTRQVHTICRVPRRFTTDRDRRMFIAIGVAAAAVGVAMSVDRTATQDVWGRYLWDLLTEFGAIATLLYARDTNSWRLRAVSNATLIVAAVGRASGYLIAVLRSLGWFGYLVAEAPKASSIPLSLGGAAMYLAGAFALWIVWRSRVPGDGWIDDGPHHRAHLR